MKLSKLLNYPSPDKIYILPTRYGLIILLTSLLMLFVGASYSNNLVFLLAFILMAVFFVSMLYTHRNLMGVNISSLHIEPHFSGEQTAVKTNLINRTGFSRYSLLMDPPRKGKARFCARAAHCPPESSTTATAYLRVPGRGLFTLNRVRLYTKYPLGLFIAWKWEFVNQIYIGYPATKGQREFPELSLGCESNSTGNERGDGQDFSSHRRYQLGDSQKHIDWKAVARGRPLLVKEFKDGQPQNFIFDFQKVKNPSTEGRLSQLALWIREADRSNYDYGVILPDSYFAPSHGPSHYRKCLEALARYKAS